MRAARKYQNLTLARLQELTGIPQATLTRWEKKATRPPGYRDADLTALANALHITIIELASGQLPKHMTAQKDAEGAVERKLPAVLEYLELEQLLGYEWQKLSRPAKECIVTFIRFQLAQAKHED